MNHKFKKENQISLNIFKNIDKLNENFIPKFTKINLASIFGLEIQRYLSSSIKSKIYNYKNSSGVRFPFVEKNYLNKNRKYDFNNFKDIKFLDEAYEPKIHLNIKQKILKKIYYYNKSNFSNFGINFNFLKKKYLRFCKNISNKKIYFSKINIKDLKNTDQQIHLIKLFLKKFKKKNKIKNKFFIDNFINFIMLFIDKKNNQSESLTKYLLVGSNMNIFNRIMSAKYLLNNKKVYSFNHANYSSSIYEDPTNEMGEFAMCNKYIDLGKFKFKKKFLKTDFFKPKIKLEKNSIFYKNSSVKSDKNIHKYLYVPNSYNFFRRYGFHRDVDDKDYIKFQKKILNANKLIFFKVHPKQRYNHNIFKSNKYIYGDLKCHLNKFGLFIIDMISQPFFSIAKTDSKILYLNFDQRKIRPDVLKLLKKRAHVVNVNLSSLNDTKIKKAIVDAINFKIISKDILKLCC